MCVCVCLCVCLCLCVSYLSGSVVSRNARLTVDARCVVPATQADPAPSVFAVDVQAERRVGRRLVEGALLRLPVAVTLCKTKTSLSPASASSVPNTGHEATRGRSPNPFTLRVWRNTQILFCGEQPEGHTLTTGFISRLQRRGFFSFRLCCPLPVVVSGGGGGPGH